MSLPRSVHVGDPEREEKIEPATVPWEQPVTVPDFAPAKPVELPDPDPSPVKEPAKVPA